ncbi:MAG: flagellar L-ring protein precursor FlgH [Flavobacteriales bacterium]|jgi:flagellar L-ring protein precursor FlgH
MRAHTVSKWFVMVTLAVLSNACVIQPPPVAGDPYYAPIMQVQARDDQFVNGSLYRENVAINLYGDRKASRIGDIITVNLNESTSSSKSSNVEITKENELGIPSVAGGAGTILGIRPTVGNFGLGTNFESTNEFTGEAGADQSNRLNGSISVTVVDVYPNGNLVIRGEKWMTLNRGEEFIRISGIVRPDDVSPDNTVSSIKIANARIQYSGTGELADSQKMGWMTRFFNSAIWPL